MIQCRACNQWGHYARECNNNDTAQKLCRWCGPGDHEDADCPKSSVGANLIDIEGNTRGKEAILALTRGQAKEARYPHPRTEKQRMTEAREEIERAMKAQRGETHESSRPYCTDAERNIVRQMLQMEVPVKLEDLLHSIPQLGTMLLGTKVDKPKPRDMDAPILGSSATNPVVLTVNNGRHPAVVEMGILGTILTDTIVDGGSGVNVLPEDTWKKLGKPTLWPPTFNLLGADQHGIKPLGMLMAQQVTVGAQPFVLDFVVIPLKQKGYDAILGRGWLVAAKANHNWKRNTLSMESGGKKFTIDLRTQLVSEELASSSGSESERENDPRDEGREGMDPDAEGILKLGGCCSEDDTDSLNGLFHWQQEDYEMFSPSCNVLSVEGEEPDQYPPEYGEYKEGEAAMDTVPAHQFRNKEAMKYEEPMVKPLNLGTETDKKIILVGDGWNPVLKTAAFKIFTEYKDVFAWTSKDLKGVPPELCVHRILLVPGAVPVR